MEILRREVLEEREANVTGSPEDEDRSLFPPTSARVKAAAR